jgi:hypothetical protein
MSYDHDCEHGKDCCSACENTFIAMIPGDGYNAFYLMDGGGVEAHPVLAWALTRGGEVRPLGADYKGNAEQVGDEVNLIAVLPHGQSPTPDMIEEAQAKLAEYNKARQ